MPKKELPFKVLEGSITAPKGFQAAGVFCDIKRLGTGKGSNKGQKRDLALIVSEAPAAVAGLFTTNQVCAAPVKVCIPRVKAGRAQAIVVNSGNANACTGKPGYRDAALMGTIAGQFLSIPSDQVLVCSTGRIGVPLPMPNVRRGIEMAAALLTSSRASAKQVAEAIMTSDTRPKEVAVELDIGGSTVRIAGICKGAGMIQPGMSPTGERPAVTPLHATMLGFITTDAAIGSQLLQKCLNEAVAQSFNRITVDGDMSTNDTVLALANGLAQNSLITPRSTEALSKFQQALNWVTLSLAKMIVADGEGASRFVTVRISGAKSAKDAEAAVRSVSNSSLVKTSWCGGDPNWGRILAALGYSSAKIEEDKIDVGYSAPNSKKMYYALRKGRPTNTSFATLCKVVAEKEFELHILLNLGSGSALMYTSDLTEQYVDFNKGDISNPAALGG